MAKTTMSVPVRIDGIRQTLTGLSKLGPDANNAIRDAALDLSKLLAARAQAAGAAEGRQAALVARTVKARRDRVPVVVGGGATPRLGRGRAKPYELLFGSEFGSDRYRQFGKPHIGRGSYWFFRTVDEQAPQIAAAWQRAADEVLRRFGNQQGGG